MINQCCRRVSCVSTRFERLGVRASGKTILENVNAEAPCGGATVLVGPNGAGKTTLLRCLMGETHYTGAISFYNQAGKECHKPVIGYVPQNMVVDQQMPLRVTEFLALGHTNRPLWLGCSKEVKKMALAALEVVGASALQSSKLGELSGGELRRVLLAAALSRKPDLLVLDEPEAGVDFRGERLFWQLLDETRRELGFSMIMVSHNLPLAAHYATHVICIKKTVIAEGPPQHTLTGAMLLQLFGVPIHLYPQECNEPGPACPQCGAFGKLPYLDESAQSHAIISTK